MERTYKHKETGAEQILTESIVETLGGSKVWEDLGEFNPNEIEEQDAEEEETKKISLKDLLIAKAKEQEAKVREVQDRAKAKVQEVAKPKADTAKPKAISLDDIDE